MNQDVINALEIMGKGMFSIFAVILVLMLVVVILTKVTNMKFLKGKEENED